MKLNGLTNNLKGDEKPMSASYLQHIVELLRKEVEQLKEKESKIAEDFYAHDELQKEVVETVDVVAENITAIKTETENLETSKIVSGETEMRLLNDAIEIFTGSMKLNDKDVLTSEVFQGPFKYQGVVTELPEQAVAGDVFIYNNSVYVSDGTKYDSFEMAIGTVSKTEYDENKRNVRASLESIESKIPETASQINKLADRESVDKKLDNTTSVENAGKVVKVDEEGNLVFDSDENKQDALNETQMTAVNSGINSELVEKLEDGFIDDEDISDRKAFSSRKVNEMFLAIETLPTQKSNPAIVDATAGQSGTFEVTQAAFYYIVMRGGKGGNGGIGGYGSNSNLITPAVGGTGGGGQYKNGVFFLLPGTYQYTVGNTGGNGGNGANTYAIASTGGAGGGGGGAGGCSAVYNDEGVILFALGGAGGGGGGGNGSWSTSLVQNGALGGKGGVRPGQAGTAGTNGAGSIYAIGGAGGFGGAGYPVQALLDSNVAYRQPHASTSDELHTTTSYGGAGGLGTNNSAQISLIKGAAGKVAFNDGVTAAGMIKIWKLQ